MQIPVKTSTGTYDIVLQRGALQRVGDYLNLKRRVLVVTDDGVPAEYAQGVCDRMIQCGIKAVWNFAPVHLDVPRHTLVQNENMATSLAVLSMHLQAQMKI